MTLTVTPELPEHADVLQRADAGEGWIAGRHGRTLADVNGCTPAYLFGYITGVRSVGRDVAPRHRLPLPRLTTAVRVAFATQVIFQLAHHKAKRENAEPEFYEKAADVAQALSEGRLP